jgi:EAL domain-containing protein (putative c-di-GMP-specific phosphodiesterase class I)/PAS domain-containing protein
VSKPVAAGEVPGQHASRALTRAFKRPRGRRKSRVARATGTLDPKTQAAVLVALEEGVVVIDFERRVRMSNAAAAAILGLDLARASREEDWLTRLLSEKLPEGGTVESHVLRSAHEIRDVEVEVLRRGVPVRLSVNYLPWRGESGAIEGLVLSFHDVSEQRRLIEAQERSGRELSSTRDFLQATLDSLSAHVAVLDERGEIVTTNRAWGDFAAANGEAPGMSGAGTNYLEACDADELNESAAQVAAGIRSIIAGSQSGLLAEYRCDSVELVRWFQVRATRYEGSGSMRVVVAHEDISERKAEERLVAVDLDKRAWVARIEEALSKGRFVLHAQPIIELASGQIAQTELLIRMRQPEGSSAPGLVPPGYFLPVAEEFGLITEIDRWVIDRSAELAASGRRVELNVSGRSISDPHLIEHIESAIARAGADPQMIVFEITETTLVSDDVSARAFVGRLHELGCKIALDDFGTGYGGFTYLKKLPIDYLKIDIEFVSDLLHNPASRTVIQAIVRLAQGFGLRTVAEGVEDRETLEALRELDVDYAQGYYIGRPTALVSAPTAIQEATA